MGEYVEYASLADADRADRLPGRTRTRSRCPGACAVGSGGYTYGDFGRIVGGRRGALPTARSGRRRCGICATRSASAKARALVTAGHGAAAARAVLPGRPQRDHPRRPGALRGRRRGRAVVVFAARGMGFFAASLGGEERAPAESFALPPGPDGPKGTITGRVTSASGRRAGRRRDDRARRRRPGTRAIDGRRRALHDRGRPAGTYPRSSPAARATTARSRRCR